MTEAEIAPATAVDEEYAAVLARRVELAQWAKKLMLPPEDLQLFLDGGYQFETIPPAKSPMQKAALAYLKQDGGRTPKWSLISGILPRDTTVADPLRRRGQLRALHKATVLLIRRALARHEADPFKAERTIYWDPAIEVCQELELAPSKLSALLKEFCGSSLIQAIDCVKAEKVRKVMRTELREFIKELKDGRDGKDKRDESTTHCASFATELDAWGVWKALKKARKWPEFSQNTWANGLGFATYRRLYRACVAIFQKTPHQIEMEIIKELLADGERVEGAVERVVVPDFMEWSLKEIEEMVRGIGTYSWD